MPAALRPLGERERFVAFAFAAADMLIEADLSGRIVFATGAFRARLGVAPETLLGQSAEDVVALADQPAFRAALAMLPARGRLEPTTIRLSDQKATPFVVSGLHLDLPGHSARLCLSFAAPPSRWPRPRPRAAPAPCCAMPRTASAPARRPTGWG